MRLLRKSAPPIAFATLIVLWNAVLQPVAAAAQAADERAGAAGALVPASAPPSADSSPAADAVYDQEGLQSLGAHLQSDAPSANADSAQPPVADDVSRALAALPTGGGSISPQATALPSGAATQLGMGESFAAQLSTGMAAYSVPFALPSARGGAQPALGLSYSSASGFGLAGVGWSIGAPAISRQTDRGVPRYDDGAQWHPEQDRFVFGGSELVPICTVTAGSCPGALPGEAMPAWANGYQYFRARVEGGFHRYFWSADHRTWRVQGKDGSNMELGVPLDGTGYEGGLEHNPEVPSEIFRWHLVRAYDSQGGANDPAGPNPVNFVVYRYREQGGASYLSDIFDTSPAANPTTTDLSLYAHHTRVLYEARPDVTTSYRQGWRSEYGLRVARVDVTSKPFAGSAAAARELVRRYHLGYDPGAHRSLLTSVQVEGRCASPLFENAGQELPLGNCPRMPPMRFEYQRVAGRGSLADGQGHAFTPFDEEVRTLSSSPPHSLDETLTEFADINADGLPDVLVTAGGLYGGRHGVFYNGPGKNGEARFAELATMEIEPAGDVLDANVLKLDNPNVTALDLDGDGIINLVHMPQARSYSVFSPGPRGWSGRAVVTASQQDVKIDFTRDAKNVRVMDVNADGLVDIVYSSPTELQTFFALGRYPGGDDQFGNAVRTSATSASISNEPVRHCAPWSSTPLRFSDPDVQVGDMNGDGLADLVRVRSGQVLYWPGRGNGFFGEGTRGDCPAGEFAEGRHVTMWNAPNFGEALRGALLLSDVSGDGLADLVEVRSDAVDIYLNDNGIGWTARHMIEGTPFLPAARSFVRLTDINGSGTPDIVWGAAHDYRYIDLTGGVTPDLLVKVHNGLGKTMELEYEPSTAQMLRAAADGEPWRSVAPVVMPVLVSTTVRDNLERIGRPAGVYRTEYSYRDPYYEGRQRELRGFREARVTVRGDSNSPTSHARTVFLLGECPQEGCGDNWREALKGLPVLSENFDDQGVYLATEHTTYTLRQLYTGLDARRVVAALPTGKDGFVYDTASFDRVPNVATVDDVLLDLPGVTTAPEQRVVTVRASAGTARVRSSTDIDDFGNPLTATRMGCVSGCPSGGADEAVIAESVFTLPAGDNSRWLWREQSASIRGSVQTARRAQTRHTYNACGQVTQTFATLSGTLALSRSALGVAAAPGQSGGTGAPVEITVSTNSYGAFGHLNFTRGANGQCSSGDLDPLYAHLPVTGRLYAGPVGANSCGSRPFVHTVTYDRGLEAVLESRELADPGGETLSPVKYTYDAFGRVIAMTHADPAVAPRACPAGLAACGVLATQASTLIDYYLPDDPGVTPYTMTRVRALDGATPNVNQYTEGWSFADGLGRTLASLSQADPTAGDAGRWIVTGAVLYDVKGALARKYDAYFFDQDAASYIASYLPPSGPFAASQYDAFGRSTWSFDAGETQSRAVYHAMSGDAWDAEDLKAGGAHQNTPMTTLSDGHGRTVQQIARSVVNGVLEQHVTLFDHLPTGEAYRITQRRTGSTDVVRWMRYDTLGRMVLNVEPNTTAGFTTDTNTASPPPAIRYAYNDSGDLVGYSDARGCGANYHYDTAGRLLAEDRSPCTPDQAAYSAPNLTTGDGTEVFYRYDVADPDSGSLIDAAGTQLTVNATLLWGRVASVSSLGAKGVVRYDSLGRSTGGALRIQRAGAPSTTLASRYAPRWYITSQTLDASDRAVTARTGVTVPQLLGAGGQSELSYSYSKRGVLTSIAGSYGMLYRGAVHRADGAVETLTLGDAAATTRHFTYDLHRRLESVQTDRAAVPAWSNPPPAGPYTPPAPTDDPTLQVLLEDVDLYYDAVGNITQIRDNRLPGFWPAGAKPVTRTFEYDDLYRLEHTVYQHSGDSSWVSPYAAEHADPTRVQPVPQLSFTSRVTDQSWRYDHLGNITRATDSADAFWDRSTGNRVHGTPTAGPHQLRSASKLSSPPIGNLAVGYDVAGNATSLIVRRDGTCLPAGASCWQRFQYEWDEVGQLSRARRWDLVSSPTNERSLNDDLGEPAPPRAANADLRFYYDGGGDRVLKTATDTAGTQRHTVYISGSLELRSASWTGTDYTLDATTASVRLPAGAAGARLFYTPSLPTQSGNPLHVFLELADHLGSSTIAIDRDTGELVELATYQPYGAIETDYRPGRWASFREPYKFTGKEEDIEVGLTYVGARYYSPYLGVWISPDPATIHDFAGDMNPYAYVSGRPLVAVDPDGRLIWFIVAAAVISAGVNLGQQISAGGPINWVGAQGVLGAAAIGAVGSVAAIGAAAGLAALGAGAVVAGIGAGAASGGVSYGFGAGIGAHEFTGAGFVGAMAGGAVSGGLTAKLGGTNPSLGKSIHAGVVGALAGTAASMGVAAAAGQTPSAEDFAWSIGASVAGSVAGHAAGKLSAARAARSAANDAEAPAAAAAGKAAQQAAVHPDPEVSPNLYDEISAPSPPEPAVEAVKPKPQRGRSIRQTSPDAEYDFDPPRLRIGGGGSLNVPVGPDGERVYGPFTHQINKGGLDQIVNGGQMRSSQASMISGGADAVRGRSGALRPEANNPNPVIEFYSADPPNEVHPTNLETKWFRPEGEMIKVYVTKIRMPDGTLYEFPFE